MSAHPFRTYLGLRARNSQDLVTRLNPQAYLVMQRAYCSHLQNTYNTSIRGRAITCETVSGKFIAPAPSISQKTLQQ